MSPPDIARFRTMCSQFRWLAVFMVVTIGLAMAATWIGVPVYYSLDRGLPLFTDRHVGAMVWFSPAIFYLFGVWSIGSAMGQLARGRLIQPTLASALRRVGLALGMGGVLSVFVAPNLTRILGFTQGGYLHFDVAGMTLGMIGGALFLLGRVVDQADLIQSELDEMI